jgi:hypothetical protein
MGTNHLSHFLLTLMLLPSLTLGAASRRDAGARVVHVASSMHLLVPGIQPGNPELKRQYNSEAAYAQSKLAQVGELHQPVMPASPVPSCVCCCQCRLQAGFTATSCIAVHHSFPPHPPPCCCAADHVQQGAEAAAAR